MRSEMRYRLFVGVLIIVTFMIIPGIKEFIMETWNNFLNLALPK